MSTDTPSAPPIRDAIDAFRANEVGTILRAAGVSDMPKSKEGKTALWLKLIGDPGRIQKALTQVTPRCRKAVETLQLAGGELRTVRYRTLLERAGLTEKESQQKKPPQAAWYHPRNEEARDPVTFEEIVAVLLKYGLIWTHTLPPGTLPTAKLGFEAGHFVYIPKEIAAHLPPPPEQARGELAVTHTLDGSARICQRDLYLVWSAARELPFQLTNVGLLRMPDLKRVAPQLLLPEKVPTGRKESEVRRIFFLRQLLTALGLLRSGEPADGNVLDAAPAPAFLGADPAERVRLSFQAWRDGAWWNELWATRPTRAGASLADFAPKQVVAGRSKVLEMLARLARRGAAWISLAELTDTIHDHSYEFLIDRATAESQSRYYYYGSGVASPYTANALNWTWEAYQRDEEAGWEGVESVFIRTVITEGLYWLGLLDLGYAHKVSAEGGAAPAGLLAVRLTNMGRWLLLDGKAPAVPVERGRVVMQPNFHVFAFDPVSDNVLAKLDSFAVRLRAERAVEYEITRDSIYRAQQTGQQVSAILAWLENVTGAPAPQNVTRNLEEWQAAFERLIVRPRVGWVQVAAPELLDAMLAMPDLAGAIIKRITPTSLLVHADKIDDVELALLIAGELPARTSKPEDARQSSITIAADGAIGFAHAVPSLYVYGYLNPFADQTAGPAVPGAEIGWRVTRASVERAHAAKLDAPRIIRELDTLALGSVPSELQRRIKAWCKHFGDAGVGTVTLIHFRDQAAADELLADPELQPYLQPFHPEARLGLTAVAPEDVATLRGLLAERGVELGEQTIG
ncbi:MAG: helicase-associated domain-containing protein [Chloroflexi bacterium]|nr:helicase-associated domain-containing protein [Chloroflexota bacterium]